MTRDIPPWQPIPRIIGGIAIVAALSFGKSLLVPIALAILFSFLLAPIVGFFQRLRLPRSIAVLLTVILAVGAVSGIGYLLLDQVVELTASLPKYTENIRKKLASIRGGSALQRVQRGLEKLEEITSDVSKRPGGKAQQAEAMPVVVVSERSRIVQFFTDVLGPLVDPLATASVVLLLVVLMLAYQESLRDRLIGVLSGGHIALTTRAFRDATKRISRYLVMNLVVNVIYGIPIGIGLYLLGVPNPILWALLTTLLRFIPYIGILIAVGLTLTLAFAALDGWARLGGVAGLYAGMEILSYNFLEPILYGRRTGLSPVAVILASVFWTWVWGILGLLVAVPMTVCLAVAGRYAAPLGFLSVLLSDAPGLSDEERIYQRVVAGDAEEATDVADQIMKERGRGTAIAALLAALRHAKEDTAGGVLERDVGAAVMERLRTVFTELRPEAPTGPAAPRVRAIYLPFGDAPDALAGEMFAFLAIEEGIELEVRSTEALSAEHLDALDPNESRLLCLGTVMPFSRRRLRSTVQRLRARAPQARVLIVFWAAEEDNEAISATLGELASERIALGLPAALEALRSPR